MLLFDHRESELRKLPNDGEVSGRDKKDRELTVVLVVFLLFSFHFRIVF